jgi:enoyl-CoA hydratase
MENNDITTAGTTDTVTVTTRGRVGHIVLDRPRALNALNHAMIDGIGAAFDRFRPGADTAADAVDTVDTVLISSASPKAFCSGGDVRAVRETDLTGDYSAGDSYFHDEYDVNHDFATFPLPTVALIDGITMGGGLGMSMHATHRVITERAWASMPEMAIGFVTDVGISHTFTHLPALAAAGRPTTALGLWLATTAYRLTPADLLWTGLATHLVADAAAFTDVLVTDGPDAALATAVPAADAGESPLAAKAAWIGEVFTPGEGESWADIADRLEASVAAGHPVAQETAGLLASANPESLVTATELFRFAADHTLRQALDAEFSLGAWLRHRPNFAEGVRAVLVDKDRDAHFEPATLAGVGASVVPELRAVLAQLG